MLDLIGTIAIIIIALFFWLLYKIIFGLKRNKDDIFDFERDYQMAIDKPVYKGEKVLDESIFIGTSPNKKNMFIPSDAKHVFVCGTTGSGKTIALFVFINLSEMVLASNSRTNEIQADTFAYEIGYGRELMSGMYILQKMDMNAKLKLTERLKASHPHMAYRIANLERLENEELEA